MKYDAEASREIFPTIFNQNYTNWFKYSCLDEFQNFEHEHRCQS